MPFNENIHRFVSLGNGGQQEGSSTIAGHRHGGRADTAWSEPLDTHLDGQLLPRDIQQISFLYFWNIFGILICGYNNILIVICTPFWAPNVTWWLRYPCAGRSSLRGWVNPNWIHRGCWKICYFRGESGEWVISVSCVVKAEFCTYMYYIDIYTYSSYSNSDALW